MLEPRASFYYDNQKRIPLLPTEFVAVEKERAASLYGSSWLSRREALDLGDVSLVLRDSLTEPMARGLDGVSALYPVFKPEERSPELMVVLPELRVVGRSASVRRFRSSLPSNARIDEKQSSNEQLTLLSGSALDVLDLSHEINERFPELSAQPNFLRLITPPWNLHLRAR